MRPLNPLLVSVSPCHQPIHHLVAHRLHGAPSSVARRARWRPAERLQRRAGAPAGIAAAGADHRPPRLLGAHPFRRQPQVGRLQPQRRPLATQPHQEPALRLPGPETAVFWLLSALRTHTKAPYKIDSIWETLRVLKSLNRPGRAQTLPTRRCAAA